MSKDMDIHTATYRSIQGIKEQSKDEHIASWQRLQYGMFIHWGPYSVFGGERDGKPVIGTTN